MRVLAQMGYDADVLRRVRQEYLELIADFPALTEPTDQAFAIHLRARETKTTAQIRKRLATHVYWMPSKAEIRRLVEEGYWPEIIEHILLIFKIEALEKTVISESKFAVFRRFLRRSLPLPTQHPEEWVPNTHFKSLVEQRLLIESHHYSAFWKLLERSFLKTGAKPQLKPKYCYLFIERNRKQILSRCKPAVLLASSEMTNQLFVKGTATH